VRLPAFCHQASSSASETCPGTLITATVRKRDAAGVEVCAKVADATELAAAVREHRPDVALIDIRMPPTFTAMAVELREADPRLGVLLLSQAVETHVAAQLLDRHAERFGYLSKDRVIDVPTLLQALQTIAGGGTVLDPQITRNPLRALSDREREVPGLMAEGRSNAAIAERLVVSGKTVESHIANIFTKLQLHETPDDHRRVLAVPAALRCAHPPEKG
jgi:DNA-binding NarL/FixJ family response regulator